MLDIFFISYDEEQKIENFNLLKSRFPRAQQIDGVKGIHRAYYEAFKKSSGSHFFTMDADNRVNENFFFEAPGEIDEEDRALYVWRCRNIVNGLVYGYGGVKLWPRALFEENWKEDYLDFTTTMATSGYKPVATIASETHFNSTPFSSWRSGFRECVKLASSSIANESCETTKRLKIWNTIGREKKNGEWTILGARMGTALGIINKGNERLEVINDFQKLLEEFEKIKNQNVSKLLDEKEIELQQLGYRFNE